MEHINEIRRHLENIGNVSIEENQSIICLVGHSLWNDSATISKVFRDLNEISIKMVSLGASDTNLSFVIPENEAITATRILHKTFFE